MPAVVYPVTLPPPQGGWAALLRERAARSSLLGNPQARSRSSDRVKDASPVTWTYSPDQMAIWRPWWHTTLIDGQLWFQAQAPGLGGLIDRVMRFRPASVQVEALGIGIARVTAQLEIRGRSEPPST